MLVISFFWQRRDLIAQRNQTSIKQQSNNPV